MSDNGQTKEAGDLQSLLNRLEWFDEERRKSNRRLTELEQKLALQEREIKGRDQRIADLEQQQAKTNSHLSRAAQLDVQLHQFKDEIVQLIEQYDQRRIESIKEADRLRRVEQEVTARELADIRKETAVIGRLQNDLELRRAEESRLANLIGGLQSKLSAMINTVESWERNVAYLEEAEKQSSRQVGDMQTSLLEVKKRWESVQNRLDILSSSVTKLENNLQENAQALAKLQQTSREWIEQVQMGEYERNQRLDKWQRVLDEHKGMMDKYAKDWINYSDQYKESKMAVQTLTEWQKQMDQQQREMSELVRVEGNRVRSQWDNFLVENEKRWKTAEVDSEQRWSGAQRREKQILEQIRELEELANKLDSEKNTLWRVQNAQADVIKTLPRIWLEEVEKAINQNPDSRRQPALVPTPEE